MSDAAETTGVQIAGEALGAAAQRTQSIIYVGTNTKEYYDEIWKRYMRLSTSEKNAAAGGKSPARIVSAPYEASILHILCLQS